MFFDLKRGRGYRDWTHTGTDSTTRPTVFSYISSFFSDSLWKCLYTDTTGSFAGLAHLRSRWAVCGLRCKRSPTSLIYQECSLAYLNNEGGSLFHTDIFSLQICDLATSLAISQHTQQVWTNSISLSLSLSPKGFICLFVCFFKQRRQLEMEVSKKARNTLKIIAGRWKRSQPEKR